MSVLKKKYYLTISVHILSFSLHFLSTIRKKKLLFSNLSNLAFRILQVNSWISIVRVFKEKENNVQQKQPSRGVLKKRYPENMQQVYRPMPKCDFNKISK